MTESNSQEAQNKAYLKESKLLIATPCYGGMVTEQHHLSIVNTMCAFVGHGLNARLSTLRNESLVTRARNTLVAQFMASDSTHLLFIDADIQFSPQHVLNLMMRRKPVVVGAYPKKAINWDRIKQLARQDENNIEELEYYQSDFAINFKFKDDKTGKLNIEGDLIELLDAGTGFMLIQREVIEEMFTSYPELFYRNDINPDLKSDQYCFSLFDTMHCPETNRYLSEDYTFCRRWQAIGGKIWLDPTIDLGHQGSYEFTSDLTAMLRQVASNA